MQPINSGRIVRQVPSGVLVRDLSGARFQTQSRTYNSAKNRELPKHLYIQTKREQSAPLHTEGKRSNLEMSHLPAFLSPIIPDLTAVSLRAMTKRQTICNKSLFSIARFLRQRIAASEMSKGHTG